MPKRKTVAAQETQPGPAPFLTDFDIYLIGQGTHERAYEKMGAHLIEMGGEKGIHFAVWAPNARQVYVMGNFNDWHGESHPMHPSDSGIWTLFVPGLEEYTVYKYRVVSQRGESLIKPIRLALRWNNVPKPARWWSIWIATNGRIAIG